MLCAIMVNKVSDWEPPMDKFGEELVLGAEGTERLTVGWPVNGVEFRDCPGIFILNVLLDHWFLGLTAGGLLKLGDDGTSVQKDLCSSTGDDGYLSQVRSGV